MLRQALGGAAALSAAAPLSASTPLSVRAAGPRPIVLSWLAPDEPASLASLQQHAGSLTHLSPTWFSMRDDLSIAGTADPLVVQFARRHGLSLHPLIHNEGYDAGVAHRILQSAARRAGAAQQIASLVLQHNFDGINLDFEGPFGADRAVYTDLVKRLAARLRPAGKWVTVDIVPRLGPTVNNPATSWSAPYDYAGLGAVCDAVVLMAYDYSVQRPGPIAPLWWGRQVIAFARTRIPAAKLVVGFPFYGRHWIQTGGVTSMTGLTRVEAQELLAWSGATVSRPAPDATPRFSWQDGPAQHVVHFDDEQSLAAKLQLLDGSIRGAAFWRLGTEGAQQWAIVKDWSRQR